MKKVSLVVTLLLILSTVLSACGGAAAPAAQAPAADAGAAAPAAPSGEVVTIEYALWDANQLPAYQACADAFMAANPNIKVNITQSGWNDYWNTIQTGMVAGTAPDVFTDHLAKYPEFAAKEQLVDIQPYVDADGVDLGVYLGQLADLWARDGKRFGLPKDWDTIAIVYNQNALDAAGVTLDELNNATWDLETGGTFQELIAKLSVDENGNNGLSPDFDPTKVKQYGLIINGAGEGYGQTEWSWLAATTGWRHIDELYATKYNYDDPRFTGTIQWYADNMKKGFIMPLEQVSSLGGSAAFNSGLGALHSNGSWMIGDFVNNATFPFGFARLPQGPEGRKSMFNGLADSIWVGTKHPAEAWQWVKYAASKECADKVGEFGVVFPAQQSGVDKALAAYAAKGVDVSAFTLQATEPDGTFLFPVTDHASEISAIMGPVMQSVMLGESEAAVALPAANEEVNALFK
ncbi:MAG TPA: sugar ABC transporter substrate-binding protein [Chloroflexi bacterium]|nr:sugar ABC transporter substrate-binding protein [Chloroflexota bacterium]HHW86295.1 sugar ABC transporter substrate-binding protein [Chloroflexota bacterium]